MEKQNSLYQFRSSQLWKDSVTLGFAIFGAISAILGVLGISFTSILDNVWSIVLATIFALVLSYVIAVIWKWWHIKNSITLKIRGIKVTIDQGNIFERDGWKVIGVDDTFSTLIIPYFSEL